jgi:hypothetical protein
MHVGMKNSLSSERSYMYRILPQGIMHGMGDALFGLNPSGLLRAGAIFIGLATTMIGYLIGVTSQYVHVGKKEVCAVNKSFTKHSLAKRGNI